MTHINITYLRLEQLFKHSLQGRHITRVVEHPFLARTLMVEFPGDEEDDEVTLDELIKTTEEKHGR